MPCFGADHSGDHVEFHLSIHHRTIGGIDMAFDHGAFDDDDEHDHEHDEPIYIGVAGMKLDFELTNAYL